MRKIILIMVLMFTQALFAVQLEKHGEWGTGPYHAVYSNGNFVYCAADRAGLDIIDISNPTEPVHTGSCDTPGVAVDVFVSGNFAYIADSSAGLTIIDINNPSDPILVTTFKASTLVENVYVKDNYAFISIGYSGVQIIDISDPTNPADVTTYNTPFYAYEVEISGSYAYIADGNSGVLILDISNPADPVFTGVYDTADKAVALSVSGNYIYVVEMRSGIEKIDVSDPENPFLVGGCDTPGTAYDVMVVDNYAYIADNNYGLQVVNINDNLYIEGDYRYFNHAAGIFVSDSKVFIADYNDGLQILDITDAANPDYIENFSKSGVANGVCSSGNFVYVAHGISGLRILDFTDPSNPELVSRFQTSDDALGVTVVDGYAYIASTFSGIQIVNVSDPETLELVGMIRTGTVAIAVQVLDNYAYVAAGPDGLFIVDISNPEMPLVVGSYNTPGYARDIFLSNGYAFVVDGSKGVQIINVSDPYNPVSVGSFESPGYAMHVCVSEGLAYMTDDDFGMYIYDVSDPSYPFLVSGYHTESGSMGVWVLGTDVYLTEAESKIYCIDYSDIENPVLIDSNDISGTGNCLYGSGTFIYAADGNSGKVYMFEKTTPPSRPENFNSTVISSSFVSLEWDSSIDDMGIGYYEIFREGEKIAQTTFTRYNVTDLEPDTEYLFKVRAIDVSGFDSDFNSLLLTTAPDDNTPPTIPENFRGFFENTSDIKLYWNASSDNIGVRYYAIYRGEDNSLVGTTTDTTFLVSDVSHSLMHRFKIKVFDYESNASPFGPEAVIMPENYDTESPSAPENCVGAGISETAVRLAWDASFDDIGVRYYAIYRSEDHSLVGTTPYTSFVIRDLDQYVTYKYKIKAFDYADNRSGFGNEVQVRTLVPDDEAPTVPQSLVAMGISSSEVILRWEPSTDNEGVRFYAIYRYEDSTLLATSYTNEFILDGLNEDTDYSFRIKAFDFNSNRSGFSNTVTTQTLKSDTIAPTPPSNLAGEAISPNQIQLTWDPSTDDHGVRMYVIYMGASNTLAGTTWQTEFVVEGLSAGTDYIFKLKAFDWKNNRSGFSNEIMVTTPTINGSVLSYKGDPQGVREEDKLEYPHMVYIPEGHVTMIFDGQTQNTIDVKSFYMSQYEVTVEEFAGFLNAVPSVEPTWFRDSSVSSESHIIYDNGYYLFESDFADYPVVDVTWYGAEAFCRWLTETYSGAFYLPSEVEWEYACRAGSESPFNSGDMLHPEDANFADSMIDQPVAVGSYLENAFGLSDMHGNVWEWCANAGATSSDSEKSNITAPIRGGSWSSTESFCASSFRFFYKSSSGNINIGFRVARICEE